MDWITPALAISSFALGYGVGRMHAWVKLENAFDARVKASEDDAYYDTISDLDVPRQGRKSND